MQFLKEYQVYLIYYIASCESEDVDDDDDESNKGVNFAYAMALGTHNGRHGIPPMTPVDFDKHMSEKGLPRG